MKQILCEMSPAMMVAAVSAFFGGIVAFFVSQVNERIKRHRKRWFEHRNALPMLEYALNEILDITGGNRHTATEAINSISTTEDAVPIVWSEPHTLEFDTGLRAKLLRMPLINKLFSYGVKIRRLNYDTLTLCRAYSEARSRFLSTDLSREQYIQCLAEFRVGLEVLCNAYDLVDERTLSLLARVRVALLKDKTLDNRGWFFYWMPKARDVSAEEVATELVTVKKEIAETQSRSRAEIKRHLG